mmetsp:Transcript_21958/g.62552  ORF Transcript_21958/g.62552 Transcript_21958/m.62552 type:complete len:123 (-) Transcript_21958:341-709(-)
MYGNVWYAECNIHGDVNAGSSDTPASPGRQQLFKTMMATTGSTRHARLRSMAIASIGTNGLSNTNRRIPYHVRGKRSMMPSATFHHVGVSSTPASPPPPLSAYIRRWSSSQGWWHSLHGQCE